jgi:hypothetical protein
LGETRAFKFDYSDPSTDAVAIQKVMIKSVNYGFTGWDIWICDAVEQLSVWTLTEANNTMNNVLAPSVWSYVRPNTTSTITN